MLSKDKEKLIKGITVAGNIIVDHNKYIQSYPEEGNLTVVSRMTESFGGCVPNTASVLRKIDPHLTIEATGRVGKDEGAQAVMNFFDSHHIGTSTIERDEHLATSNVDAFVNVANTKRTFFVNKGADEVYGKQGIKCHTTWIHVGYVMLLPYLDELVNQEETRLCQALDSLSQKGVTISVDLVSEESNRYQKIALPVLKHVDYLIINEIEASKLIGKDVYQDDVLSVEALKDVVKMIKSKGVRKGVVVHAPTLSAILRDNEVVLLASLNLPSNYIVNTVGAGDAFCAGALYGLMQDYEDVDILRLASCVAAASLKSKIPTPLIEGVDQMFELEKKYGRKTIS